MRRLPANRSDTHAVFFLIRFLFLSLLRRKTWQKDSCLPFPSSRLYLLILRLCHRRLLSSPEWNQRRLLPPGLFTNVRRHVSNSDSQFAGSRLRDDRKRLNLEMTFNFHCLSLHWLWRRLETKRRLSSLSDFLIRNNCLVTGRWLLRMRSPCSSLVALRVEMQHSLWWLQWDTTPANLNHQVTSSYHFPTRDCIHSFVRQTWLKPFLISWGKTCVGIGDVVAVCLCVVIPVRLFSQ